VQSNCRHHAPIVLDNQIIRIPAWVHDLASFRRWVDSDDFPENGRICWLAGEVWIDMSKEQVFSHNQVKQQYNQVLGPLAQRSKKGRLFPDGVLLTNLEADLSCKPDGLYVSFASFRTGLVRLVEGAEEGIVELEGSPDMALEVVSAGSVEKDTVRLRELYWQSGIREYWLVDVRGDRVVFDLLRHTAKGYVAIRKQAGWVRSAVFRKSFRLTRGKDALGNPEYTLAVR
jgi:Uma2 family endonuclease